MRGYTMKKFFAIVFATMIALAGFMLAAAPASATESEVVTETYSWLLPDGGTPDNVTWPQSLIGTGDLTPEQCGATAQVDTYTGTREEIDAVVGDGILTGNPPEDSGIVVAWHYNTSEDCVVVPPKPEDRVTSETRDDTVCVDGTGAATLTSWQRDTTFPTELLDNVWVEGAGVVGEWFITATNDVHADNCVIVVPPVEPPVVEPPVVEPPVVEPPVVEPPVVEPPAVVEPPVEPEPVPVALVQTSAPAELAETGVRDMAWLWLIGSLLTAVGVTGLLLGFKFKRDTELEREALEK